jgi:hypothetical protein
MSIYLSFSTKYKNILKKYEIVLYLLFYFPPPTAKDHPFLSKLTAKCNFPS